MFILEGSLFVEKSNQSNAINQNHQRMKNNQKDSTNFHYL